MHAKFEGENLKIERAVSILVKWVFIMWSNLKWRLLLFEEQKKMIRSYMTSFDRSLMDYDSINNPVDHMILLPYVLKMRFIFQTEISSVTTTEQCQTVQYIHNVNYLLFSHCENPIVYFFYIYLLYMAPSTCIFHELMWYLLCSIVYDFKIRCAVRRWLKLPN
jgi:hypothetical protein